MRYLLLIMIIFVMACGVNPERAVEMQGRSKTTTKTSAKKLPKLTADDGDPQDIKDAIANLDRVSSAVDAKDWGAFRSSRYDVAKVVIFSADEAVATHSKTPQIISKLQMLDAIAGESMGEIGKTLADPSRENSSSADAIFAISEGVSNCHAQAPNVTDAATLDAAKTDFEAKVQKGFGFDPRAERFSGRSPSGNGFIDVPTDVAVCRALLDDAEQRLSDLPTEPVDRSSTYAGCGYFDIQLEAKQLSAGGFDKYVVTSFFANEPTSGAAEPIGCEKIPPVSDAPNDVQGVLKEAVQWLQETDLVSMQGAFAYEQRTPTEMIKKGTARVYRRQAQLQTNRCGAKDKNVTCTAEGNELAKMFDRGTHYMKRAEAYRAKSDTERCLRMARAALEATNNVPSTGDPTKIFQITDNRRLTFTDMKSELESMHTQASEIVSSDWCKNAP